MFYLCLYTWSNTQGVLNWYLVHLQVGQRNVLFYTWKLKMIYLWESVTKMLQSVSLIQLWHLLPFACPSIPPFIHPTLQHWSLRFSYANHLLLRRTREPLSLKCVSCLQAQSLVGAEDKVESNDNTVWSARRRGCQIQLSDLSKPSVLSLNILPASLRLLKLFPTSKNFKLYIL